MLMPKGPNRQALDRYLDTAQEGVLRSAGEDWKQKATALRVLGEAMRVGARQAELRIGEQTVTGPAVRQGMEESAASMETKSEQLQAAAEALLQVSGEIEQTRAARDAMVDLGPKPESYPPMTSTTGLPPTPEEIQAHSASAQARQGERDDWQAAWDQQEARALVLTQRMDTTFLDAIPPMKDIHGQKDPTEPPPNVPSGPGGPYLPGAPAPVVPSGPDAPSGPRDPQGPRNGETPGNPGGNTPGGGGATPGTGQGPGGGTTTHSPVDPGGSTVTTPVVPQGTPHTPVTTVLGAPQGGIDHSPTGSPTAAPTGPGGVAGSAATSALPGASAGAALAGGAGAALAAGAGRGGSQVAPARPGSGAVRPGSVKGIGSTVRNGGPGSLTRGAPAGSAPRSGAAPARGAAAGSTAARPATSPGSSSGTRAAAGSRGAGSTGGARTAGKPAPATGAGAAAGRKGGKGDREKRQGRDALVYEQDWLDDDVAPGVLD